MSGPLLSVADLAVEFRTRDGIVQVLDHISLDVAKGETVGIVGESGSGKSVLAFTVMGVLDAAGRITEGRIDFAGLETLKASEREMRDVRGREMSMIFQSPRTALNPIRKVGHQIEDVLRRHEAISKSEATRRAVQALKSVRIPDPERRYHAYPFELSGGMCQRVMIAMALACKPFLLIADEPTTGLDVTTQAVIMELIRDLGRNSQMATILITHDLGLAGEYCDRIAVMHAGQIVEYAPTGALLERPAHPYTAKLIAATPTRRSELDSLSSVPGNLPDLRRELPPCRFSGRCERHAPICDTPPLPAIAMGGEHVVHCRRPL